MSSEKVDLAPQDLVLVLKILKQFVPDLEVRAFGSRANHTAKKFSDLDLVLMSENPLPLDLLGDLVEAFSDSTLSIKIDLLDWSRIDEEFKKIILQKNICLQRAANSQA